MTFKLLVGEYKGGTPVCCFPFLSSFFREGMYLIDIVRSVVGFHLSKAQEQGEKKV